MKSGDAFILCPACRGLTAQTVAIIGIEGFVYCHECHSVRVAEGEELPQDFDRPASPWAPGHHPGINPGRE